MQLFPGRAAYLLVFAVALTDAVWIGLSNISLPLSSLLGPAINIAVMLSVVVAVDRHSFSDEKLERLLVRMATFLQGMVFLQLAWLSIRIFNHVSMSYALPYSDDLLAGLDSSMGFDWEAYFRFVQDHGFVRALLDYSYDSLTLFSFAGYLVLIALPDTRRASYFLEAFLVTAVICTATGVFFPARGTVVHYLHDFAHLRNFDVPPGVYFVEPLARVRSGIPLTLDVANLPGLVAFPSFHAAAGIILVAAFWRSRLFPAALAYTLVMIASTPIFGGHYFVDLMAGMAVALAVAGAYMAMPHYAGVFRRRASEAGWKARTAPSR